jgi:hypothetical protein
MQKVKDTLYFQILLRAKISYNIEIRVRSKFKNYATVYYIILLEFVSSKKKSNQYWTAT